MNNENYFLEKIHSLLKFSHQSGGYTETFKVTGAQLGVDGAAYISGDVLGDKAPIAIDLLKGPAGTGVLQSIIVQDLSNQSGALDIIIFDDKPTATTFTDNAAIDIADADLPKVIGVVAITASDYKAFADNAVATKVGIGLPIKGANKNHRLWFAAISRDTKTYVADELSIVFGILQD